MESESHTPGPPTGPSDPVDSPRLASPSPSPTTKPASFPGEQLLRAYTSPGLYSYLTQNVGLVMVAGAQFFFTCMNLTVKYFISISSISIPTLILVRMVITVLGCNIALLVRRDPHPWLGPPDIRRLLAIRGFTGFVGLASNYLSYYGLKVSDSTAIQFLSPSVTALLGFVLLKETMKKREIAAGFASFIGVMFVSRPPFLFGGGDAKATPIDDVGSADPSQQLDEGATTSSRMAGVAWATVTVFSSACAYISIRAIGERASALHSMAYFGYLCILVSILAIIFDPSPFVWVDSWFAFSLIMLVGVFGFFAQMLLTLGLQREKAGRAGLAMYSAVFFSLTLEIIFFHVAPAFLSVLGIMIILTAGFLVARSSVTQKAEENAEAILPTTSSDITLNSIDGRTYAPVATDEPEDMKANGGYPDGHEEVFIADGGKKERHTLRPPSQMIRRRSSAASTISGFTSIASECDD